jgi:anti-sigma regulatory factor (Ser/Thr protein kinase)
MPEPLSELQPISLRPELSDLVRLVAYIEDFALRHDMPHTDSHAFMLASEELFANTISHSHPKATLIEFSLCAQGIHVAAVYTDDGSPFDPTLRSEAGTALPLEQRPIGGLGIHFIRRTMSTFRYQRSHDRNIITFGRDLAGRSNGNSERIS